MGLKAKVKLFNKLRTKIGKAQKLCIENLPLEKNSKYKNEKKNKKGYFLTIYKLNIPFKKPTTRRLNVLNE